ncbi:molybdenum cofactor synthesis protein-like protein [Xylogone sp. PMI_703]|nr:molybdenum cofactor synthesis protein-like protein [Xylogone sp. PMI_703]
MDKADEAIEALKRQITETEEKLAELKQQLASLEVAKDSGVLSDAAAPPSTPYPLSAEEYRRYGRQMIVPHIGIQGQLRLKKSSVLIVGAGGLGCPAAAYLAGSGVGTIGLVDGDVVETSNLHRQIIHSTSKVGMTKVDSAILFLRSLNPNVTYNAYPSHLTPENSVSIFSKYDLILDCTDHPTSRYLISDACVVLQKPLVSASALRTDGQLIVLNSPPLPAGNPDGGPCYRCVFPKPPPVDSVVSCGDGGILGPVVGAMGVLQALEAINLITGNKLSNGDISNKTPVTMLLFSGKGTASFRSLKMKGRRADCFACSGSAQLTEESLTSGSLDYVKFCGVTSPVHILLPEERIEAAEYNKLRYQKEKKHILVDTREKVQFDICNIDGSINVPFSTLHGSRLNGGENSRPDWLPDSLPHDAPIYVVCRLGNDSQVAVKRFKELGLDSGGSRYIGDIRGGLRAWRKQVDQSFPEY